MKLTLDNIQDVDFDKGNGIVPAIVQDHNTKSVLMLGYVNAGALITSFQTNRMTFWSRSKERLWTKGEQSRNFLNLVEMYYDCDKDTILALVVPQGPTCHTGEDNCFALKSYNSDFLVTLESIIEDRKNNPNTESYTSTLFAKGINKIAQKVGEEAVELVIESKDNNDDLFLNEAADLMYHYLILLIQKGYKFQDVISILESRHRQ